MREATDEELRETFEDCIESAKTLITESMRDGETPSVSPSVFLVMRKAPDSLGTPLPVSFKPFDDIDKPVKVGVFNPATLTPPGWDKMPVPVFWTMMKLLAEATDAYANIVAMETWLARPKTKEEAEKIPESLANYEHREEALVVTAERAGEYRVYQSLICRDGEKFTLEPWEMTISNASVPAGSRYDRLRTEDPLNDDPDKMRVGGNVFRSISANRKS